MKNLRTKLLLVRKCSLRFVLSRLMKFKERFLSRLLTGDIEKLKIGYIAISKEIKKDDIKIIVYRT